MIEKKNYNWAVLGCGVIANEFAEAMKKHNNKIYAIANRSHEKAVAYGKKYDVEKVYDNYKDIFEDDKVHIIYITTPHNTHIQFLREALSRGKHVLCEKSITLNNDELEEAITLANDKNVVLGEAMTLYHMPLYKKLDEIVNGGDLGDVNVITINFGSYKEYDMNNRFFNRNLAGGAMLDIGVYALSFARWFLKSNPQKIVSQVKYASTKVDEQATILMMNEEQQMVTIAISLHSKQPKRGMISCDKGYVEIMEYPRAMQAVITYTETGEKEIIQLGDMQDALWYEIEDMEKAVTDKAVTDKAVTEKAVTDKAVTEKAVVGKPITDKGNHMHLDYTKDVMEVMTQIRKDWKMSYPEEIS